MSVDPGHLPRSDDPEPVDMAESGRTVSPEGYIRLAQISAIVLAGIIFTGAAVRLTQSGLGCEDWPACSEDRLVPEWAFHSWIEFGNRLLSGIVAAGVIAAVLGAYRRRPRRPDLIRWAWGLVAGVVAQIVLGGVTVLVDLHPLFVSAHFLLSIVLMWNALILLRKASVPASAATPRSSLPPALLAHSRLIVAAAVVVLVLGTLVTGAGPHSGDASADRLALPLTTISRIHAVAAWGLVALTVAFALRHRAALSPTSTTWLQRLVATIALQGGIGYWQYFTGVPALLVELHVIGATAVWCCVVWFHTGLSYNEVTARRAGSPGAARQPATTP